MMSLEMKKKLRIDVRDEANQKGNNLSEPLETDANREALGLFHWI